MCFVFMKNFSFNSPALQFFFVKNAIFFIIFVGKTFVYQNIYGFTPVKKRIIRFGSKLSKNQAFTFQNLEILYFNGQPHSALTKRCALQTSIQRSNPIPSTYRFERSKPFYGDLKQPGKARYPQVQPGKARYSQVQQSTVGNSGKYQRLQNTFFMAGIPSFKEGVPPVGAPHPPIILLSLV